MVLKSDFSYLVGAFVVLIILVILFQGYLLLEHQVLFYPLQEHIPLLEDDTREEIWFGSQSQLHGWFFCVDQDAPVVLFCHGNAGNISYYQHYVIKLCRKIGLSLFIFDYQGFGKSKGSLNLATLCDDGAAAYQFLISKGYTSDKIIVWGESLGGMIAIDIAAKYDCERLLLMATFSSLADLVKDRDAVLGKLAAPFLCYQESSNIEKITHVRAPVFIVHSEEDDIIPHHQANLLYNAISHPWKFLVKIKGTHVCPQIDEELFRNITRFVWKEYTPDTDCRDILKFVAEEKIKHGVEF